MGGTTKEMGEKGLTLEEVIKEAEASAQEAIRQLRESIDHGFMTYPELIEILESCLKEARVKIKIFKPGRVLRGYCGSMTTM